MKYLNQFLKFAWNTFADGKRFLCIGTRKWLHHETKEVLGTKVDAVVMQDKTNYGDKEGNNLYEKICFKVPYEIDVPMNVEIIPKGVEASVYGDFRNLLACTAEDIEIISK